jgi:hypothetical protein
MMYLAEFTLYDPVDAAPVALRIASAPGYKTRPWEVPASTYFEGRLLRAGNFEREVFGDGRTGGSSVIGTGAIEINNGDHALDWLERCDWRGAKVWMAASETAPFADFRLLEAGRPRRPAWSGGRLIVTLREPAARFTRAALVDLYAGTNDGSDGIEGDANTAGKAKPLALGWCPNVTPVLVNRSLGIWQVSNGSVRSISTRVRYAPVTDGGDVGADITDPALSMPADSAVTDLARGLFRLSFDAGDNAVTADVEGDDTGGVYVSDAAGIVRRIAERCYGVTAAELDLAAFTAVSAARPWECGIYLTDSVTGGEAFDRLMRCVNGWWTGDLLDRLTVGRMVAPAGVADLTISNAIASSLERVQSSDDTRGLPVWRVGIGYGPNWTVMAEGDVAGTLSGDDVAWAVESERLVFDPAAMNVLNLLNYQDAPELTVSTLLRHRDDAAELGRELFGLHGVLRNHVQARVPMAAAPAGIDLGRHAAVTWPYYGLAGGVGMVVLGLSSDGDDMLTVRLWG